MKPKTFLFVGLIMLGVSLIIITVVILYPSTQIKDYPRYQKCLDDFTKIYSMDGKIDKVDNIAITAICDITHSSPSNSTIVLATFGGLFLIGGILQTIIGTIWLLVSWIKRRRKGEQEQEMNKSELIMFIGIAIVIGVTLIILVTLIFNPFGSIEPYYYYDSPTTVTDRSKLSQQQQQCFDKYAKIFDFDKDNKTDEDEDQLVSEICNIRIRELLYC